MVEKIKKLIDVIKLLNKLGLKAIELLGTLTLIVMAVKSIIGLF